MKEAAGNLEFEEAARLRDEIRRLEASELGVKMAPTARAPARADPSASRPADPRPAPCPLPPPARRVGETLTSRALRRCYAWRTTPGGAMVRRTASFADRRTAAVFQGLFPKGLPPTIAQRAQTKLAMLDAAASLGELRVPPGNRLETLRRSPASTASASVSSGGSASWAGRQRPRRRNHGLPLKEDTMAAIKREDLEAGRVDLSDVIDPAALPLSPVSPGEVLRAEFLEPLQMSATRSPARSRCRATG